MVDQRVKCGLAWKQSRCIWDVVSELSYNSCQCLSFRHPVSSFCLSTALLEMLNTLMLALVIVWFKPSISSHVGLSVNCILWMILRMGVWMFRINCWGWKPQSPQEQGSAIQANGTFSFPKSRPEINCWGSKPHSRQEQGTANQANGSLPSPSGVRKSSRANVFVLFRGLSGVANGSGFQGCEDIEGVWLRLWNISSSLIYWDTNSQLGGSDWFAN